LTDSAVCPACGNPQAQGLLDNACTTALETLLTAVPILVDQLNVATSKQARLASGGKAGKGSVHERSPINMGAVEAADALHKILTPWATAITGIPVATTVHASHLLLHHINEIRRHPSADKILYDIARATKAAYLHIDRTQERQYLGQCLYAEDDLTCHAEIWARPGAHQVTCSQCGITHEVHERRAWLLTKAEDMIVTVKEASSYLGEVGGITVSQASIRGYLHRGRIAYRPGIVKGIRLGDLLTVVLDDSKRKTRQDTAAPSERAA
jgi:hypothetical protein